MKKLLSVLLAISLLSVMAACGRKGSSEGSGINSKAALDQTLTFSLLNMSIEYPSSLFDEYASANDFAILLSKGDTAVQSAAAAVTFDSELRQNSDDPFDSIREAGETMFLSALDDVDAEEKNINVGDKKDLWPSENVLLYKQQASFTTNDDRDRVLIMITGLWVNDVTNEHYFYHVFLECSPKESKAYESVMNRMIETRADVEADSENTGNERTVQDFIGTWVHESGDWELVVTEEYFSLSKDGGATSTSGRVDIVDNCIELGVGITGSLVDGKIFVTNIDGSFSKTSKKFIESEVAMYDSYDWHNPDKSQIKIASDIIEVWKQNNEPVDSTLLDPQTLVDAINTWDWAWDEGENFMFAVACAVAEVDYDSYESN